MTQMIMPKLPQEWEIFSIGEIAQIIYGKALRAEDRMSEGSIPVFASNGIVGKHNEVLHPGPSIIIGRKGTVGAIQYVPGPFWCIDTAFYLSEISSLVDIEFLAYVLGYIDLARLSIVVGVPGINRKDIESQQIPIPPLSEQQRIVAILRQADELRRLRHEVNEKAATLTTRLFYEMFGVPSSWQKTLPLSKLVNFVGGGTPSRKVEEYFTGDIPWATSKDIKSRYLDDAEEHITQKAIRESATNLVPAGTILLVVKSKILMHTLPVSIITRPFCFGQDLKGLVPKSGIEAQFIAAALIAQSDNILKNARGVNTEGLTLDILREIPVPQVDDLQQIRFVEELKLYDQIENSCLASKQYIDTLFQSLLAQTFTGELTAKWREKQTEHAQVVEEEILESFHQFVREYTEEHDLDLTSQPITLVQRPGTRPELSEEQNALLYELASIQGYFTAETLKAKIKLPPTTIRQGLQLFAEIGLIRVVRLPDRPMQDVVVYILSYRGLREEDQAKTLDLDVLLKEAAS